MIDKNIIKSNRMERILRLISDNSLDGLMLADVRNIYWATLQTYSGLLIIHANGEVQFEHEVTPTLLRSWDRIGIDSKVSVGKLLGWELSLEAISLIDRQMERIQVVKDDLEILLMRFASQISADAWESVQSDFWSFRQIDLVAALFDNIIRLQGDNFSFDPSVAVDLFSQETWSRPDRSFLKDSSVVVVDFGASFNGYHSDVSRVMLSSGGVDQQNYLERLEVLQDEIISTFIPGESVADIAIRAEELASDLDLVVNDSTLLGHGIGLKVHTYPYVTVNSDEIIEVGSTIAVEPAIKLPNGFGMRIEDVILIEENGPTVLSRRRNDP